MREGHFQSVDLQGPTAPTPRFYQQGERARPKSPIAGPLLTSPPWPDRAPPGRPRPPPRPRIHDRCLPVAYATPGSRCHVCTDCGRLKRATARLRTLRGQRDSGKTSHLNAVQSASNDTRADHGTQIVPPGHRIAEVLPMPRRSYFFRRQMSEGGKHPATTNQRMIDCKNSSPFGLDRFRVPAPTPSFERRHPTSNPIASRPS